MNLKQLKRLVNETVQQEIRRSGQKTSGKNWDKLIENTVRFVLSEGEEDTNKSVGFRVIDADPAMIMQKLQSLADPQGAFQNENPQIKDKIEFQTGIMLAPGDCEPTQDCIVAAKSLKDQCQNNFGALEKVLTGGLLGKAPGSPIVIFQSGGVNYVLDGHHRWSQYACANPEEKVMECSALSASGLDTPEAALAVCHAAIIALTGNSITKGGDEDNLLEMDQETLYGRAISFCQENFTEPGVLSDKSALEVIKLHAPEVLEKDTAWYKPEGEMETWANYLAYNGAKKLKGPAGTNNGKGYPRIIMPQLADHGINVTASDGGHGFDKGNVNIKDPIKESFDLSRWNKLAGTLKD